MKKKVRPKNAGEHVLAENTQAPPSDGSRALELLLAQTSAALEKANRQLLEKDAETILIRSECQQAADRYYALLNNIPGAVYRCANDDAWTMEFISKQIEELSGYPAEDYINNSVRTYASIIHPDDVIHVFDKVQAGLKGKKPYVIEYRVCHRDGSIRWVWERGQGIFNHEGELNHLDGVIFDISDRIGTIGEAEHAE